MMKKKFCVVALCVAVSAPLVAQSEIYPEHFDLEEVRLLDSRFSKAMFLNDSILFEYDVDRLLTAAIVQSGLNNVSSSEYYKWENKHPVYPIWYYESTLPHYVSSLAIAYAANHDEKMKNRLKERLEYVVRVIKDCQDVFDGNMEGMDGYVGTEPLEQVWKELYKGNTGPFMRNSGWCPLYYIHKMLAGLRDAWMYADVEQAKEMYRKMADWSVNIVSHLNDSQIQGILGVEHGGMVEVLADAYRIFGDSKYLDGAKRYNHVWLLNGMQTQNATLVDGQHANATVPKFMGFERIYQEQQRGGLVVEDKYRTAAHHFWDDVAHHRTVCIGGNSVSEHFIPAAKGAQYIDNLEGPETCNSYNMLKLSEILFDETHDARYADFYESTMFNHILSTQNPHTGGLVYFTSLRPQSYRIYSTTNLSLWCCVGTGWENHSRYGHFIYTHSVGNDTLYVNLFTPSVLASDKFGITQETEYPELPSTRITVNKGGTFTLAVRHPWWTTDEYAIRVNGEKVDLDVKCGVASYVRINRTWTVGDVVEVDIPMELRYEECPNYTDYIAFKYGPILLGAQTTAYSEENAEETGLTYESLVHQFADGSRWGHSPGSMATPKSLSSAPLLIDERAEVLKRITPASRPLEFSINVESDYTHNGWKQLTLVPFYQIHESRYQCYWYNRSAEDYTDSDMAKSDSLEMALNVRTVDFVGTGEPQSELSHEAKYSESSTSGIAGNEIYRDVKAGGFIEYTLFNHQGMTEGMSLLCRFNVYDHNRQSAIYIDDVKLVDVIVPSSTHKANAQGLFDVEYTIPSDLMMNTDGSPKRQIKFRLQASASTMAPGLYYLRLLSGYEDKAYRFVATDWIAIDPNRVTQDKFVYDEVNNTFTVNAGKGQNNVCMQLDYSKVDYTVEYKQNFLLVVGENLSTADGRNYLWWLNGINKGTQVKPQYATHDAAGNTVIAWNISASGLNANAQGNIWHTDAGITCFGLTSTTGSSIIRYIGFVESVEDYLRATDIKPVGNAEVDSNVDVYNLYGMPIRKKVARRHCTDGLQPGIYIIDRKKIVLK
jgi:acetyl-coA carboxylase, biotin carboxylase subunit